ncbi:substrate import-associated zinc metallohydrolase lipoprotein [Pedobacter nototheniae]|uniref:substrate import-associated zinc metallohydrolase lipoprotein n=1 Tax=Pedobacter nototheniae TaxID=2488994 RepID=UPI00103A66E9|nr:substrate import-associated zinc metallohydrolase lipoprotein [Pedobacter nototheniae]
MKKIFLCAWILSVVLVSCKKEKALNTDLSKSILDGYKENETDKWLKTNFLDVYNMEVLYRFDSFQLAVDRYSTPVKEDKVIPTMELVRKAFINPYIDVAGKKFFMPRVPKEFGLFGSALYRAADNTPEAAGNADAGRQINLFVLNDFDPTNKTAVISMMHVIHHEFTHILNQTIPVPAGYEGISNNYIGDNWVRESLDDAHKLGFISAYSRKNKMEDFAEMVSFLLVEGQTAFDNKVASAPDDGGVKLRQKEQMVVDYFKIGYGIDFRVLQDAVKKAI